MCDTHPRLNTLLPVATRTLDNTELWLPTITAAVSDEYPVTLLHGISLELIELSITSNKFAAFGILQMGISR